MKRSYKVAAAITAAAGISLAAGAFAHPGQIGNQTGRTVKGGMQHGAMRGAQMPEERRKLMEQHRAEMHKRAEGKEAPSREAHKGHGR